MARNALLSYLTGFPFSFVLDCRIIWTLSDPVKQPKDLFLKLPRFLSSVRTMMGERELKDASLCFRGKGMKGVRRKRKAAIYRSQYGFFVLKIVTLFPRPSLFVARALRCRHKKRFFFSGLDVLWNSDFRSSYWMKNRLASRAKPTFVF